LGGGIYFQSPSENRGDFYIINNTLAGNSATHATFGEQGGGMALVLLADNMIVANNIMAFNSSGIWLHTTSPYDPQLVNNDVFNTDANYVNLTAGATDISEDPLFADPDGVDDDPATSLDNDYHLTADSPAVDAGDNSIEDLPDTDVDGDPRILDGNFDLTATVDMGADEFNQCPGDLNGDGDVDGDDLSEFLNAYANGFPEADLNGDTEINAADVAVFAANYGRNNCSPPNTN
jgi:hypothetical protein